MDATGPIALVAPAPAGPSDRPNGPITSDARVGPRPAAGPAEAAPPVDPTASSSAAGPAGTGRASADLPEPNSRLRAALDDLDRAWTLAAGRPPAASGPDVPLPPVGPSDAPGAASRGASAPPPAGGPATRTTDPETPGASVDEFWIGIDVARDGRRFAGPRAAAVLRALAGRLHRHLPPGASLVGDDRDGLSIRLPTAGHAAASGWVNRTLPGLLDDLTLDDDLARLHLRSAVHGPGGPVGAQLLVRLDRTHPRAPAGGGPAAGEPQRPSPPMRVAGRDAAASESSSAGSSGPPDQHDELTPAVPDRPAAPPQATAPVGRHDATGRTPFRPPSGLRRGGSGSRRRRSVPEPASDQPAGSTGTDGLGLADLLAGALAAYRGI